MHKRIPLSEPIMAGNEWAYVKECIDSGWVSSAGRFVDTFAQRFADFLKIPNAVPVVNGTAALHISLIALGLKPDEEVLVPTLTFAATANAVVYCNAYPVFMDVEPTTLGLDPQKIEDFMEKECSWRGNCLVNKLTKRRVRGIIPVHLYGHPVDMSPILEIAKKYELFIVEDATESLGSKYKGRFTGTLGETGAFSFNGNKIITTGGGGMVVTEDTDLAEHIKYLTTQAKAPGPVYYHAEIGYNYRLTNVQAAIGLAQLEKIDEFIAKRRAIAHFYQRELKGISDIIVCGEAEWAESNYWLSWMLVGAECNGLKDELLSELNSKAIEARAFFIPLHTLPPYRSYQAYRISTASDLYDRGINLPSHTGLEEDDLEFVVETIRTFLGQRVQVKA